MPRENSSKNSTGDNPESSRQLRLGTPHHSPNTENLPTQRPRVFDHNHIQHDSSSTSTAGYKQRMSQTRSAHPTTSTRTDNVETANDRAEFTNHPQQPNAQPSGTPSRMKRIQRLTPEASTQASSTDPEQVTNATPSSENDNPSRTSRKKLLKFLTVVAVALAVSIVLVIAARWLRTMGPIQDFLTTYSGHTDLPPATQPGIPSWVSWQHALNIFFLVLIARTGLLVRLERKPPGYWQPTSGSFFSPPASTPKKVSLSQFVHQVLDVLWMANGLVFIALLFITGHWKRIVPLQWDIFPHMASAAIQYLSLDWPTEHGWVHYNALQLMAYFVTVFIAAPLAIISGIRISTWWPDKNDRLNKIYPVEAARAIHFPVMFYFLAFTVVHVFLVFFTGALRNLNAMYTSRDAIDGWGLLIFTISLGVIAVGWFLIRPIFIRPLAARSGTVTK